MFKEEKALTKHTVSAPLDNSNAALLHELASKREGLTGRPGENRSRQTRSVSYSSIQVGENGLAFIRKPQRSGF